MPSRALLLALLAILPADAWASQFRIGASFEWSKNEFGSSVGGLIQVAIPLDRLVSPLRGGAVLKFAEETGAAPGTPRAPAPPRVRANSSLARGVVAAARRVSERAARQKRLDGLATRARVSATLPELALRAARSTDQTLRLSPGDTDVTVYDYTRTGGADLLLEARATWTLDRLVFADEELGVERLEQDRAEERLVDRVLGLLFAWERARERQRAESTEPEARLAAEVDELEAEAALDVLSDGWFSDELGRRARVRRRP
jgi:hypothetical protein